MGQGFWGFIFPMVRKNINSSGGEENMFRFEPADVSCGLLPQLELSEDQALEKGRQAYLGAKKAGSRLPEIASSLNKPNDPSGGYVVFVPIE